MPKDNLQKQKFSCVTQLRASLWEHLHLQKQKFSCVTQHTSDATASVSICKSRNFLVLLNRNVDNTADSASAKAEIFLCYSTESGKASINRICKSRNFLVLLNSECCRNTIHLQKQKFSCVTQLLSHSFY